MTANYITQDVLENIPNCIINKGSFDEVQEFLHAEISRGIDISSPGPHGFTMLQSCLLWFECCDRGWRRECCDDGRRDLEYRATRIINILLECGANPNSSLNERSPLRIAVSCGWVDIVAALVKHEADVHGTSVEVADGFDVPLTASQVNQFKIGVCEYVRSSMKMGIDDKLRNDTFLAAHRRTEKILANALNHPHYQPAVINQQ